MDQRTACRFGSWMGGDRDGNPFVTPETTRDVVITARLSAVNLYFEAIEQLMFELSNWRCSEEMKVRSTVLILQSCEIKYRIQGLSSAHPGNAALKRGGVDVS